jgi:hypothetical protein
MKTIVQPIIISLLLISLAACTNTESFDEILLKKVIRTASFDLMCGKQNLEVVRTGDASFEVSGCGKQADYMGSSEFFCKPGVSIKRVKENCQIIKAFD